MLPEAYQPPQPVTRTTVPFPVSKWFRLQIWVGAQFCPMRPRRSRSLITAFWEGLASSPAGFSPDTQMLVGT